MTKQQAETLAAIAVNHPAMADKMLHDEHYQQWRWMKNKPAAEDTRLSEEGREIMAVLREAFGGYPENLKK